MFKINGKDIEIHVKGGFSERKGIKHFSDIVQTKDLNERTRNKLYTASKEIFDLINKNPNKYGDYFVEYVYEELFSLTKRDIPNYYGYVYSEIFEIIYGIFQKENYIEVFTFIEGIINAYTYIDNISYSRFNCRKYYIQLLSTIFKTENVNYRIIDGKVTDIVNEEQINSIEETLNNPYKVVSEHYSKAIEQLYSVKDYANSIKESISTVEAMCQIINGSKETLGKALNNLKVEIHPALKSAYSSIYGYTSDENGTRHANGIGEKNATFEEAKYMLVSCSAFVNYLKENFEEENKYE